MFIPPENTRKPKVFYYFKGVEKGNTDQEWVNYLTHLVPISLLNPFQSNIAFHIETSHLICYAK